MTTLAPKLPWKHPYAPGYPGRGSQALPTDPDAVDYLNRVAAADGGVSVEVGIAQAIDAFVRGCKADGIWDAIKASCIMCGARTINGALVPLVGPAPTAVNFVSANYNRETGLVGVPASNTYIDTNRNNNADPQNDSHMGVYVSTAHTSGTASPLVANSYPAYIGTGGNATGSSNIGRLANNSADAFIRNRSSSYATGAGAGGATGFVGVSRNSSTSIGFRAGQSTSSLSLASQSPFDGNLGVFRSLVNETTFTSSNARLTFYSIGTSVDLAALDARVTTLVSQIAAAIP